MTLKEYLDNHCSSLTTHTALTLWDTLRGLWPSLREPDACGGPDGTALLAWDDGCHHLEFEIKDRDIELYYLDRQTGHTVNFEHTNTTNILQIMTVLGNTFIQLC